MALKQSDVANFETLKRACADGALALVQCKDAKTGEYRAVIAAVSFDGNEYNITPFGHMCTGNPYEDYIDPIAAMEQELEATRNA